MLIAVVVLAVVAVGELGLLIGLAVSRRVLRRRLTRAEARLAADTGQRSSRPPLTGRAVRAVVTTASRLRNDGFAGMLSSSLDDLEQWAREDRGRIARLAAADGSVTLVFTDIVESTARNEELGDQRWLRVLAAHERVVRAAVTRFGGSVIKNQGDGFMIAFRSPAGAVAAAVDVQREASATASRVLRQTPIGVRIGAHTGVVVSRDGDFFGRNVAVAARVAALAGAGEILVTEPVVRGLSVSGLPVRDRGARTLKGIAEPVDVFAIDWRDRAGSAQTSTVTRR